MTSSSVEPSVEQHEDDRRTRVSSPRDPGWSLRSASLTAGVGILLMSVLAGFGNFVAVQGLVTEGNAAQTANSITGSEGLFRFGIVSLLLVAALDIAVACALYRVFSPVSRSISMLAAALRLVYAGVFLVAIGQLVGVLHLLGSDHNLSVFTAGQVQAQVLLRIEAFNDIWGAALVLFGLHLLLISYLAHRSGYVPRFIAMLVAVAGLGYLIDSIAAVLSRGSWTDVSSFTFIGEFLLALWLVLHRPPSTGRIATAPQG